MILKLKFRNLHTTVVNSVNPAMNDLLGHTDKKQKTRNLLNALYKTENPQAFVKLYAGIKEQSNLQWLIDRIDSESTGDSVFLRRKNLMCIVVKTNFITWLNLT